MEKKEEIEKFMITSEAATSLLKSFASIIPLGTFFSEFFQFIIPQYREKRFTAYLTILSSKLSRFEEGFIKSKFKEETFADLLEDSFRVAMNTVSEEKKEYIANIIVKSITSEDVEYSNQKYLLSLLSELNDIEIIILNSENHNIKSALKIEFNKRHKEILSLRHVSVKASKALQEKSVIYKNYYLNLVKLGLLDERFQSKNREQPNDDLIDYKTGKVKVVGYELSKLGRVLLEYIGINEEDYVQKKTLF